MGKSAVAEEYFVQGEELLRAGEYPGALEAFRQAYRTDPSLARYTSAYGLGIALVERRFKYAKGLCEEATRLDPTDAKLLLNLGRVYLSFGFRAEGVRALDRGLAINSRCKPIIMELKRVGFRRRPVIPFFSRDHLLNKWFGRVRARMQRGKPIDIAEAISRRI